MKLYKVPDAPAGSRWQATQDGARRQHHPFEQVTVAEDGRQGMCEMLNAGELECYGRGVDFVKPLNETEPDILVAAEQRAIDEQSRQRVEAVQRDWEASDIEDFVLNRASVAQAENIFACFGNRFKELARGGTSTVPQG